MGSGSSLDVLIGSLGPLDLQVLMDYIRNQPDYGETRQSLAVICTLPDINVKLNKCRGRGEIGRYACGNTG